MIIPDVNVWIDALRTDAGQHEACRTLIDDGISGPEPLGISDLILSGVVRILTNPRVLPRPFAAEPLLAELDRIRAADGTVVVRPGARHWSIFVDLCRETAATANEVPDAFHAALAIEHGASFVSSDRALARFPGLDYRHPLN